MFKIKKLNSNGFGHIELVLVAVVMSIIGFAGYKVATHNTANAATLCKAQVFSVNTNSTSNVSCIRTIQKMMNVFNGVSGTPSALTLDGQFGTQTRLSVITFQKAHSLSPDGVVGVNTWYKLCHINAAPGSAFHLAYDDQQRACVAPPADSTLTAAEKAAAAAAAAQKATAAAAAAKAAAEANPGGGGTDGIHTGDKPPVVTQTPADKNMTYAEKHADALKKISDDAFTLAKNTLKKAKQEDKDKTNLEAAVKALAKAVDANKKTVATRDAYSLASESANGVWQKAIAAANAYPTNDALKTANTDAKKVYNTYGKRFNTAKAKVPVVESLVKEARVYHHVVQINFNIKRAADKVWEDRYGKYTTLPWASNASSVAKSNFVVKACYKSDNPYSYTTHDHGPWQVNVVAHNSDYKSYKYKFATLKGNVRRAPVIGESTLGSVYAFSDAYGVWKDFVKETGAFTVGTKSYKVTDVAAIKKIPIQDFESKSSQYVYITAPNAELQGLLVLDGNTNYTLPKVRLSALNHCKP